MTHHNTTTRTGEPRLASVASWAVLTASFGLSATTWIALAQLAGFTNTMTVFGVTLALAWLMPIAVDGYVVVALVLWMAPVPKEVAAFAKRNTYFAAGTGILAQSAYHLLSTMSTTSEIWRVVLSAVVGALPPTVAGLAVHMRALIRRESNTNNNSHTTSSTVSAATATTPTTPQQPPVRYQPPTVAKATAPINTQSTVDTQLSTVGNGEAAPASTPEAVAPNVAPVPTPAEVATRITPRPAASTRPTPAPVPETAAATTRPRTSPPATTALALPASSTDSPVNATEPVQLVLPVADPVLLARAREVARQYRHEHDTAITQGQLAVRLRIPTEQASQLLQALDDASHQEDSTVNGRLVKANR